VSDQTPTPEPQSELRSAIAANTTKKRTILVTVLAVLVVAAVAVGGVVLGATLGGQKAEADGAAGTERLHLTLAVSEDSAYQDAIKEVAAEKGLDLEWVNVDDWVLPNTELAAGNVDGNAFQHILYLSAFNAEQGADITPVFSTLIVQWGIFSATLGDVADIPDGARIAIPDDPANGGRALHILEAAGLITLAVDAGDFPTTSDINSNPRKLSFVEIAATTIPQQFDDPSLSAVVVGTSYFDPSQNVSKGDALYLDDPTDDANLPYVNVVATTADRLDNPAWKILEQVYADPRVATALEQEYFGNNIPVDVPVEKLRAKLAELEKAAADTQ